MTSLCLTWDNGECSASASSGNQCLTGQNVPSPLVPCSPIQGNFLCLHPIFNRFLAVDCPNDGFEFILRANDPSDPSIRCCAAPTSTVTRDMLKSSLVSPFIRLTVGSEIFNNGVRNNSQITTETLLQTNVVANCMVPTGPATEPAPPTEPTDVTCANTMPASESFGCRETDLDPIFVGSIGTVSVTVDQSSGLFTLTASPDAGSTIKRIRFRVRVKKGVTIPLSPVTSKGSARITSFDPFSVAVPSGQANCCGLLLRIRVIVTLRSNGSTMKMAKGFNYRMSCNAVCSGSGEVVPFSSGVECPECET